MSGVRRADLGAGVQGGMSFSFPGAGWWKEVGEMAEKCAWEVLDGSGPCLVSSALHFLCAALHKRINAVVV